MPRALPWLKDAATAKARPRPSAAASTSAGAKRRRLLEPQPGGDDDFWDDEPALPTISSPPPAPSSPTAEDNRLREGYDADDMWMMVEDELLATAQLYTQHLHHAEYVRLQKEARERENENPKPGPGVMAGFVAHHKSVQRRQRRPSSSSDDQDAPTPIGDQTLADLMNTPRRAPMLLRRGTNSQAAMEEPQTPTRQRSRLYHVEIAPTKTPAPNDVLSETPERPVPAAVVDDDDETDDDLDAPVKAYKEPFKPAKQAPQTPDIGRTPLRADALEHRPQLDRVSEKAEAYVRKQAAKKALASAPPPVDPFADDINDLGSKNAADILARRRNKPRSTTRAGKNRDDRNDTTTEIPTFLF